MPFLGVLHNLKHGACVDPQLSTRPSSIGRAPRPGPLKGDSGIGPKTARRAWFEPQIHWENGIMMVNNG